jgi:hypothetical protein
MAANIADSPWTVADIIGLLERVERAAQLGRIGPANLYASSSHAGQPSRAYPNESERCAAISR